MQEEKKRSRGRPATGSEWNLFLGLFLGLSKRQNQAKCKNKRE